MFGFTSKKTVAQSGILAGLVDIHSHILPGVDDGITSAGEAVKVLDAYAALGVKKVVFTPHIMEEYPQNTTAFLRERFEDFRKTYAGGIELSLGAEYMIDNRFGTLLASDDLLPVVDNFLLIETAFLTAPVHFSERLKAVREKNYFVILAHPERYTHMGSEDYRQLKDQGVLFQLNLLSLTGSYGRTVEKKARELLYAGSYDFLGTDIHSLNYYLPEIRNKKLTAKEISRLMPLKDRLL